MLSTLCGGVLISYFDQENYLPVWWKPFAVTCGVVAILAGGTASGVRRGWVLHERENEMDTMISYVRGLEDATERYKIKLQDVTGERLSDEALARLKLRIDNEELRRELAKVIEK